MKNSDKNVHAFVEIVFAFLLIIFLYFFVRYLDEKSILAVNENSEWKEESEQSILSEEAVWISIGGYSYQLEHEVLTYLVMGTDKSGNEEGTGREYQGAMADVLMLLVIDEQEERYGILQLNRDTITEITMLQHDGSDYASADMQLCTAHWYGGDKKASCENTVNAVQMMLGGLPIDGYYALQMEAMAALNHEVGGVTVTLEDDMTALDPQMKLGETLTLTDAQAELLLHARYDMADDRNTERMRRQRLFMDGFFEKVMELQKADSDFVIQLYDSLHPYATESININEMTAVIELLGSYENLGVYTIEGESLIGQQLDDGQMHWEFYMDEDSLEEVMYILFPLQYIGETEDEDVA